MDLSQIDAIILTLVVHTKLRKRNRKKLSLRKIKMTNHFKRNRSYKKKEISAEGLVIHSLIGSTLDSGLRTERFGVQIPVGAQLIIVVVICARFS